MHWGKKGVLEFFMYDRSHFVTLGYINMDRFRWLDISFLIKISFESSNHREIFTSK